MTQTPLEAIGKALGGRDHSTILYGSEKIAKETANNETTKSTIDILIKKLNVIFMLNVLYNFFLDLCSFF